MLFIYFGMLIAIPKTIRACELAAYFGEMTYSNACASTFTRKTWNLEHGRSGGSE